ncbi:MAG: hypothetical protein M1837_004564 [Sclerophora amabilis]|nr:MAG: hypothetical protein M1837_004564 [Sclerophora amabilis]
MSYQTLQYESDEPDTHVSKRAKKALDIQTKAATLSESRGVKTLANDRGHTMLATLDEMRSQLERVSAENKENKGQIAKHEEEIATLTGRMSATEEHTIAARAKHKEEIATLTGRMSATEEHAIAARENDQSYLQIRSRYLSVIKRDRFHNAKQSDHRIIDNGNKSAHSSDPLVEAQIFDNGMRLDHETYSRIYGFRFDQVMKLRNKPVALAMLTRRGNYVSQYGDIPSNLKVCFEKWYEGMGETLFTVDFVPGKEDGSITPREKGMRAAYAQLLQSFSIHEKEKEKEKDKEKEKKKNQSR